MFYPGNMMKTCTAFAGASQIASGELADVAMKTQEFLVREPVATILVFDDATGEVVDLDLRGTLPEPAPEEPKKPGRPKLGVVAREVTLLPRHWEWLNSQPGGASVALRKLVEEARRVNQDKDRVRQSREAAYRFMTAMAGNEPLYEEALRALFSGNRESFVSIVRTGPTDVRDYSLKLADPGLDK